MAQQQKKATELQAAMGGKPLNDKQAQGALSQAVSKIATLNKKAAESKEAMIETGSKVVHMAETQGSLFLSSMAEGYLGEEKLKVGGVDVRAPVGLLAEGYGLYQTLSGEGGGDHALALGNGILGSWLASVGRDAGRTLAEKRGAASAQPAAPRPPAAPSTQGAPSMAGNPVGRLLPEPTVTLSGPVREVLLTPAPQAVDGPLRPRRQRVDTRREALRSSGRFPRASDGGGSPEADEGLT